jgi:vacuolar-type H+-ATPase subunit I/STV1
MVAAGMVYIRKRQYSFAMTGDADVMENRKSLFNRRSYFIILSVLLGIAMVVFAIEIIFSIAVPVRDIVGALISSAILAYILQLVNAFRNE